MLGFRIAALRKQAGMNQAELARLLQVSPSAVGMYEQGRREPSAQMLLTLAQIFGVSVDYLLTGSQDPDSRGKLETMVTRRIQAADQVLRDRKDRPFSREELAVLFAAMLLEPQ